jgi:hypothetical protein
MTEKTFISFSNTYINLVANSIRELLENNVEFSLLVTKNPDTIEGLPKDFYADKSDMLFDFTGWTFEEAGLEEYIVSTMIAIDGPNGETGEFELNIPFLAVKAIIINDLKAIMVSRPFDIAATDKHPEILEPQDEKIETQASFDTSDFELSNADGIAHSMSKLKLCTLGE